MFVELSPPRGGLKLFKLKKAMLSVESKTIGYLFLDWNREFANMNVYFVSPHIWCWMIEYDSEGIQGAEPDTRAKLVWHHRFWQKPEEATGDVKTLKKYNVMVWMEIESLNYRRRETESRGLTAKDDLSQRWTLDKELEVSRSRWLSERWPFEGDGNTSLHL